MRVPKLIVCPYCEKPFERGPLTKRFTCPLCNRYIKITDIEEFYTGSTPDNSCEKYYLGFRTVRKLNKNETEGVKRFIKRIFVERLK